ncbi:hypothetical protein ACLOJK_022957 [Asimina triloba]
MDHLNLLLCDELLLEILLRLPSNSNSNSASFSLVCKRWLSLHRSSKTNLSLRIPPPPPPSSSSSSSSHLSTILSHYPSLLSLTLLLQDQNASSSHPTLRPDSLLLSIASHCHNLRHLRFFLGPISPSALTSLSASCRFLTSLNIHSSLQSLFSSPIWLFSFPHLKDLSVHDTTTTSTSSCGKADDGDDTDDEDGGTPCRELPLESLYLAGIGPGNRGLGWLWRSCTNLSKLELRVCQGTGDGPPFSSFVRCLRRLRELCLRTCRTIADDLLLTIAHHCTSLTSLRIYDGGSRTALHLFFAHCRADLRRLDLRLPLDLDDHHLSAMAAKLPGLSSLGLQSCCLVTGDGLKQLASALGSTLEELALINCDAVERHPGLLTSLGQSLRQLRRLDLSYNDLLFDKELCSMLPSCNNLVDIKLRGCWCLTDAALLSVNQCCKLLQSIDIMQCRGIGMAAVELFILNSSSSLSRVVVEESKLSDAARAFAVRKLIQFS